MFKFRYFKMHHNVSIREPSSMKTYSKKSHTLLKISRPDYAQPRGFWVFNGAPLGELTSLVFTCCKGLAPASAASLCSQAGDEMRTLPSSRATLIACSILQPLSPEPFWGPCQLGFCASKIDAPFRGSRKCFLRTSVCVVSENWRQDIRHSSNMCTQWTRWSNLSQH